MADIQLLYEGIPALLPMLNRSPGRHVSEIINYLCLSLGHYDQRDKPNTSQWELGNALEHAIIHRYELDNPDRFSPPGEFTVDDLHGTPDLLEWLIGGGIAVHEIKLTWASAKNDILDQKMWRYIVQLKAYAYMLKTLNGILHVCFINGDYKGSGPIYRVYGLTFTQDELDKNWRMLLNHRELAK